MLYNRVTQGVQSDNREWTKDDPSVTPCEDFLRMLTGRWVGQGGASFPTTPATTVFDITHTFAWPSRPTKGKFMITTTESFSALAQDDSATGAEAAAAAAAAGAAAPGIGMHFDSGFLKCTGPTSLSWMLAHNSGNTEALSGSISMDGATATFRSDGVGGAAETVSTKRVLMMQSPREIVHTFFMATQTVPKMTPHLQTRLFKVKTP